VNILVVEDQKMICDMLVQACVQKFPGTDVRVAKTGAEALAQARESELDLVLLDLGLPDADGLELVPEIFAAARGVKIIVLSGFTDEFTVHRALKLKVHAFLDKNEQPLSMLATVIAETQAGRLFLSPAAQRARANLHMDPLAFNKLLSDREQHLLGLFGRSLSNEEVAVRYGLSVHTVKIHRRNIMGKLGLHSTPHLIRYAVEKGFARLRGVAEPFSQASA
jgi:DNA-binding NarL/FixJ family response regulator